MLKLDHEGEDKEEGRGGEDPGRVSEKVCAGLSESIEGCALVGDGLASLCGDDVLEGPEAIEDRLDVVDVVLVVVRGVDRGRVGVGIFLLLNVIERYFFEFDHGVCM